MPIHLLQLGPYPPPEGGVSRNMLAIRNRLLEDGDRCSIIATTRSTNTVDEPDVYHPRSAAAIITLIRKLQFDVLHLHLGGEITSRVLSLAMACSFLARGRCVLTMHSGGYSQRAGARRAGRARLAGMVFRRFSRLIAVNEDLAGVLRRSGVADNRIAVIAPHSLSAPDPALKIPTELASFLESHSPVLLSVGGLEPDYDPMFQIGAMKDLLTEYPSVGLMIVGQGSKKNEVLRAIRDAGLEHAVYLAGNVNHAITLHLIKYADMLLRTTLFDGDAISIREALFLGTPVIATDVGRRPEGVELIPIGDRTALLQKLKETLGKSRGDQAEETASDENIVAVTNLYRELVQPARNSF